MNKMHVTFPLCLSGLCSWKESPPPPSYPNAACTVLGVNSSTINRKYAFSVLLCFETVVISSTLFQFRLCHSRSTMREWKGNWVGHPKTLSVLACIPQYMGAVQGLSQGYAVGKEKNLEPFKSRIISTLTRRHGLAPENDCAYCLGRCRTRRFWQVAHRSLLHTSLAVLAIAKG